MVAAGMGAQPILGRRDADLRVPLRERAPVRGDAEDHRRPGHAVRGVRRTGAAGVPSRGRALQGLRLLQHRLRHRPAQARDGGLRQGGRRQAGRQAGRQEAGEEGRVLRRGAREVRLRASAPLMGGGRDRHWRYCVPGARLEPMSARHVGLLAALSAIWGGSYLLIKYALEGFSAGAIVSARCLLASVVLAALGAAGPALRDIRARPGWALILGVTAVTAPFLLITFGEHVVPSGLTAVLVSPASLFVALLAPFIDVSERIDRRQGLGMAMGLGGVALVVGVESIGKLAEFLGALAMVGAAFFYALSSFVVKRRYGKLAAMQTSWVSVTVAGVLVLPLGLATTPGHTPDAGSVAALAALGVIGTAAGFIIFYKLINEVGAGRAALVSYLAPGVALFYGALFRDEAVTMAAVAGLVLILGGVAIASRPRRTPVRVAAPEPARA